MLRNNIQPDIKQMFLQSSFGYGWLSDLQLQKIRRLVYLIRDINPNKQGKAKDVTAYKPKKQIGREALPLSFVCLFPHPLPSCTPATWFHCLTETIGSYLNTQCLYWMLQHRSMQTAPSGTASTRALHAALLDLLTLGTDGSGHLRAWKQTASASPRLRGREHKQGDVFWSFHASRKARQAPAFLNSFNHARLSARIFWFNIRRTAVRSPTNPPSTLWPVFFLPSGCAHPGPTASSTPAAIPALCEHLDPSTQLRLTSLFWIKCEKYIFLRLTNSLS